MLRKSFLRERVSMGRQEDRKKKNELTESRKRERDIIMHLF